MAGHVHLRIKIHCLMLMLLTCFGILGMGAAPSGAIDKDWNLTVGSGYWDVDANWSPFGVPLAGDVINLTQGDATDRTVWYRNALGATQFFGGLQIEATGTGSMTLDMSLDYTLQTQGMAVGVTGTGKVMQSAGANLVKDSSGDYYTIYMGFDPGSLGEYFLGGTGIVEAAGMAMGLGGTGNFTQSGGTATFGGFSLATNLGGKSTVNLSDGNLNVFYQWIGERGEGTFIQTGGTNTIIPGGFIQIAHDPDSVGRYELQNGEIVGPGDMLVVGRQGDGKFIQSGGKATLRQLIVGSQDGGVGGYELSNSGELQTQEILVGEEDGSTGTVLQSGGAIVTDKLTVGMAGHGEFVQDSGTSTVNNNLVIADWDIGTGSYSLQNGILNAGVVQVGLGGTGTFEMSGGTLNITSYELQLGYFNNSKGSCTQTGGEINGGNLALGIEGGSYGKYELRDPLALNPSLKTVWSTIGRGGAGEFVQDGGTHQVSEDLDLGVDAGAWGSYHLVNGYLETNKTRLAWDATGAGSPSGYGGYFVQEGGTHKVNSDLVVANNTNSTGRYELKAGTLEVGGIAYVGLDGTGQFVQDGGTHTVHNYLVLGSNSGGQGTYELNDGILKTDYLDVGGNGTGKFIQKGGSVLGVSSPMVNLSLGKELHSQGTYEMQGGSLETATLVVGASGRGEFSQANAAVTLGSLTLGAESTAEGTFTFKSGLLKADNEYVGQKGKGTFIQENGSNEITDYLTVGWETGGDGNYTLKNGSLNSRIINVGEYSTGKFVQEGGLNITQGLTLGGDKAASGKFELHAGDLQVAGETYVGYDGQGEFILHGGSHTLGGDLYVGTGPDSTGFYNLKGGYLETRSAYVGQAGKGTLLQEQGTVKVNAELVINALPGSTGKYELQLGSLSAGAMVVNTGGTFTQSGGTLTSGDLTNRGQVNLTGGAATVNGATSNEATGNLNISAPAVFNGPVTNSGTVKTTGTTVTFNNTFTNAGAYLSDPAINVFNSDLIAESTGYLVGGNGDIWRIGGNFFNTSTKNLDWDTNLASLFFINGGSHTMQIPGLDKGQNPLGYLENFAWGALDLTGQDLILMDAYDPGGALYVRTILGLVFDDPLDPQTILNIHGYGLKLYYDPLFNPDLDGKTFALADGGYLMAAAAPLPGAVWLLLTGLAGLAGVRRWQG